MHSNNRGKQSGEREGGREGGREGWREGGREGEGEVIATQLLSHSSHSRSSTYLPSYYHTSHTQGLVHTYPATITHLTLKV